MSSSLPISNIIPITVSLSPVGSPGPTFNQGLIVGSSGVISSSTRLQQFTSVSGILGAGFTSTSPEYIAATLYFGQTPSPTYLWIGAQILTAIQTGVIDAAGTGYVVGDVVFVSGGSGATYKVTTVSSGTVTGIQQLTQGSGYSLTTGEATTGGTGSGLTISITALGESPLQAIQACRAAQSAWYSCMFVGPSSYQVASASGSASSSTTVTLSSVVGTVAIGQIVTGTGVPYGTYVVSGSGTTWVLSNSVSLSSTPLLFYAATSDADIVSIASYIEAATPFSTYFVTSGDAAILTNASETTTGTASINSTALTVASGAGIANGQFVSGPGIASGTTVASGGGTTSITLSLATTAALTSTALTFSGSVFAYLQSLQYRRTFPMYSTTQSSLYPNNIYASAAPMGYAMGANSGAAGSYFTLAFKPAVGVAPEPLTQNQFNIVCGAPNRSTTGQNTNALINWNNGAFTFLMNGTVPSGSFFDITLFLDVLVSAIQYNAMNLLVDAPSIPLNQAGINQMVNVISQACTASQTVGFINSSGIWQGQTIGPISAGTPLPEGFYIYSPNINTLTPAQRAARQFPPMNVLIILAESGQSLAIQVNVQP